jgi:hypothetical protein
MPNSSRPPETTSTVAAILASEIHPDVDAYGLLRGIGNLCAGADGDSRYDARRMVGLLITGLLQPRPAS